MALFKETAEQAEAEVKKKVQQRADKSSCVQK